MAPASTSASPGASPHERPTKPLSPEDLLDRIRDAGRRASERHQSLSRALSTQAKTLRDDLDAWRSQGRTSFALANAHASQGPLWKFYNTASAPWRAAINRVATACGAEALLVSVSLAHMVAAGAALVAAPVVYMVLSDGVRVAEGELRDFLRARRVVAVSGLATIPLSFFVATSNGWRCYGDGNDDAALSWVLGVPLLHTAGVCVGFWVVGKRDPGCRKREKRLAGGCSEGSNEEDGSCTL